MNTQNNELTIDVYVRPDQMLEPFNAKVETLYRLQSTGHIDDFSLHSWPEKITLSERTPYNRAIDAFTRMEAWAKEYGFSIQPPFIVRTITSDLLDERRTVFKTPVMCLAVYVGEQLAGVFPHSRGDESYSVTDAIAALKTDELELFMYSHRASAPPPDRCSECDNWMMNVQGIGVCQDCDRIELGTIQTKRDRSSTFSP